MGHELSEQRFSFIENEKNESISGPKQNWKVVFRTVFKNCHKDRKNGYLPTRTTFKSYFGKQVFKTNMFSEEITGFICHTPGNLKWIDIVQSDDKKVKKGKVC